MTLPRSIKKLRMLQVAIPYVRHCGRNRNVIQEVRMGDPSLPSEKKSVSKVFHSDPYDLDIGSGNAGIARERTIQHHRKIWK